MNSLLIRAAYTAVEMGLVMLTLLSFVGSIKAVKIRDWRHARILIGLFLFMGVFLFRLVWWSAFRKDMDPSMYVDIPTVWMIDHPVVLGTAIGLMVAMGLLVYEIASVANAGWRWTCGYVAVLATGFFGSLAFWI